MICSLELHPRGYQLTTIQRLAMPFVSTYALRHLALANQERSACKRLAHRVIAVIELIPIVGLMASLIERIIMLVRDCLCPRKTPKIEMPVIDQTFPEVLQNIIYNHLTIRELEKLNVELNQTNEIILKILRDNILTENPEYKDAVKFWIKNEIPLNEQLSRLKELRTWIFGTDKWKRLIERLKQSFLSEAQMQHYTRNQTADPNRKLYAEEIPQLPENIYEVLNADDDSISNAKVKDTHFVTLIPKTINLHVDADLSIGLLQEAENYSHSRPFKEHISFIEVLFIDKAKVAHDQTVEKTHWSFIGYRNRIKDFGSVEECEKEVNEYVKKNETNFVAPKLIDFVVSCLLNSDGKRTFFEKINDGDSAVYENVVATYCEEKDSEGKSIFVRCQFGERIAIRIIWNDPIAASFFAAERKI